MGRQNLVVVLLFAAALLCLLADVWPVLRFGVAGLLAAIAANILTKRHGLPLMQLLRGVRRDDY